MEIEFFKKGKIFAVAIAFIGAGFLPNMGMASTENTYSAINTLDIENLGDGETEYWALLVAVGVYADDPQQNRPLWCPAASPAPCQRQWVSHPSEDVP